MWLVYLMLTGDGGDGERIQMRLFVEVSFGRLYSRELGNWDKVYY